MAERSFKYYAFISYSHKDEAAAEDIQRKLSFYRLPGVVRRENPLLPQHVRPIFRDKTNLNAGLLQESLRSELDVSKFLIVICSPNSAASYWVNEEVKHFIEIGRREYIIPVIVGGEPQSADPALECFCPALKRTEDGDEFLGIDTIDDRSRKKEQSVARIVAKLLGLDFDTLWNWQLREQKRTTLRRRLIAGAAIIAILVGGMAYWQLKLRVTNRYFVNYVDKWGMPTGIHELTKKDIASRAWHYRFEYKAGKLRSVSCEDSFHNLMEAGEIVYTDRPAKLELEYDHKDHNLVSISCYDADEEFTVKNEFRNNYLRVNRTNKADDSAAGIGGFSLTNQNALATGYDDIAHITSYSYERNKEGFITRQFFHSHHDSGSRTCTADGVYGMEYELNDDNSVRSVWFLGKDGQHRRNRCGVARMTYDYDGGGNIVKVSCFTVEGKPVCNEMKWSVTEQAYENGNLIEQCFYDVSGKALGGGHNRHWEFDANGKMIKECFLDADGIPVVCEDGYAITEFKYDGKGLLIEKAFMNDKGIPVSCSEGYAALKRSYDKNGRWTGTMYFDEKNKLVCCNDGYAELRNEYDNEGHLIKLSVYDESSKPVVNNAYGASQVKIGYNEAGRICELTYGGINGEAVLGGDGFHKKTLFYNEKGWCLGLNYFGIDNEPVMSQYDDWRKCASVKNEFDDMGNVKKVSFYDTDMNLCTVEGDISQYAYSYDEYGHWTGQSYLDVHGKPVYYIDTNSGIGFSKREYKFDEYGNYIEQSFYDTDGKLADCPDGWAYECWKFDEFGNSIEDCHYNVKGELAYSINDGYARATWKYDENRNVIEETCYNADGSVIVPQELTEAQETAE